MTDGGTNPQSESLLSLRTRAEKLACLDEEMVLHTLTLDDARLLFHELRVHQIELELQNEELRRTQLELESSRASYFALYDLAPIGYLTLSEHGLIQKANLAAATMLGVVRNELDRKPISTFIYPEDQDVYYLHRKKVLEAGEVQLWEMRMVRGDGSPFWARLNAILSNDGEYWITLVDITARKLAEEKLQASEEKFKTVIMSANDGIVLQERSGKIVVWNHTAERVFDLRASQVFALSPVSYDWKTYREDGSVFSGAEHPSQLTFATKQPCSNVVMKVVRESGDYSWININTVPIFDAGNPDPAAVIITFSDITERKQTERVLQSRLRISKYAFKHSLDKLLTKVLDEAEALTDSQIGFFHFVNADQATLSIQTWSSNTLKTICAAEGKSQHCPLDRAGVWADCIREKKPLILNSYESIPNRKGLPPGHAPVKRELVVPIFRNNLVVAVLGVGNKKNDYTVTEMKTLQHLANLAWDIVTRKRVEEELIQAKEAAESANRAKSNFLATMSHEIRTPLSAMLGNVELLEGSPLTPQQQEYLNDCKFASQMLLQVINDVLDFSKIESGKLELVKETFSVSALGRQLVRVFAASARQKGLELSASLADDLPEFIHGDQQRLSQIVANLISNAIKFTVQGAVSLEIAHEPAPSSASPDKEMLRIVVRDTGIGIPPDKLNHIFESFTQVESFSVRRSSGTGLGLPICRRLLALMGGSITVSSVVGEGSVFTVVLPITRARSKAKARAQAHIPATPQNILLADDDERGRGVAQKLLQRRGYTVTTVENGAELLDALQKATFDIVLTDISMPDMDGTQVARIIRSGERVGIDPHIPIIAMTAHAFAQDRERFIASGIDGYVAKPVNIEELFTQIEELCHKGGD